MYKEIFAQRLKKARLDTGFTQNEVAKEIGVSRSKIAKLETGTQEPTLEQLGILAEFYNVRIDWLLGTKNQ